MADEKNERKFGKTIGDLLEYLKGEDLTTPFMVSCDEELIDGTALDE